MSFLKLIRFPNLIIVALTQCLLYILVFSPYFQQASVGLVLNQLQIFLLVFTTICIAAGGYIINDILDYEIDQINKPDRMLIGRTISKENASRWYIGSIVVGMLISLYLAVQTNNLPLFFIYPLAVLLLFLYSKYFKKSVLIGNLIVALFCAFVAGIVWLAERHSVYELSKVDSEQSEYLQFILLIYLGFAFLSTLYREIIKDLEDQKGDMIGNCKTLPIVFGANKAKAIAAFCAIGLIGMLIYLLTMLDVTEKWYVVGFIVVAIVLPLIYSLMKLVKAITSKDFHQLSQIAKAVMLMGLVLLFLIA